MYIFVQCELVWMEPEDHITLHRMNEWNTQAFSVNPHEIVEPQWWRRRDFNSLQISLRNVNNVEYLSSFLTLLCIWFVVEKEQSQGRKYCIIWYHATVNHIDGCLSQCFVMMLTWTCWEIYMQLSYASSVTSIIMAQF